ncbi:MAG: hypothetical protein V4760_09335 [Bdellovibrionota bacterium]
MPSSAAVSTPTPTPSPSPGTVSTPVSSPLPGPVVETSLEPLGFELPSITPWIAFDVLAVAPTENAVPSQEKFRFRTLDLGARFDFDSDVHAVVTVGGRDSLGEISLRLREGFVAVTRSWSEFRAGHFFLNVGLLNGTPRARWPFPTAPLSHTEFFADERAYDSGGELTLKVTDRLSLGIGLTNGYWYGSAPTTGGDKPLSPTHYVRPTLAIPIGDGSAIVAVDYLSRVDFTGERTRLSGLEVAFSRGSAENPTWMTWIEVHHRYRQPSGLALEEKLGGYVYNQARIDRRWSAGLRLDALTIPTLTAANGQHRNNLQAEFVPVVTYRLTDATQLKTSYTYMRETRDGDTPRSEQRFELQFSADLDRLPTLKAKSDDRPSL